MSTTCFNKYLFVQLLSFRRSCFNVGIMLYWVLIITYWIARILRWVVLLMFVSNHLLTNAIQKIWLWTYFEHFSLSNVWQHIQILVYVNKPQVNLIVVDSSITVSHQFGLFNQIHMSFLFPTKPYSKQKRKLF